MIKDTQKAQLFWAVSMLISFLLPGIGYLIGKAGDCAPREIDGQCGMSTFFAFAYGVIAAVVIAICSTAYLVIVIVRQRKASSVRKHVLED